MTVEWWKGHGYLAGRLIDGGMWIVVMPMIYTFRVAVCDEGSIYEFYCYPEREQAMKAYGEWDGRSAPLPGWTRHHR